MLKRAYSTFEIKSFDESTGEFEGIASTPQTDRMGDVVEPKGAQFSLPLPLLWQHNSREPIGLVTAAKVTKDGITVKGNVMKDLLPRISEAWTLIRAGLVRGLSIGFSPIESEPLQKDNPWGPQRFLKWDWLELSAVTIPANAEASIQTIKSIDNITLAALGQGRAGVVRLDQSSPGASGNKQSKEKAMTYSEQIASWVAKRAASAAAQDTLMTKAKDAGVTLDVAEQEQYDALDAEIEQIDGHVARLKKLEDRAIKEAKPVPADPTKLAGDKPARASSDILFVKPNVEKGVRMARYAMALYRGEGSAEKALAIVRGNKGWMDTTPELETVFKTAVLAGDTTTSGWASELVYAQNVQSEFIEFMRPMTILGRLTGFRQVPFNIRVPSQTAGGTGYWVGQGKAIPVSKLTTSSATLGIAKAAGLMAIDDELARSSSPSAELLVRNDLAKTLQALLDIALIDPNQGGQTNIQPASLTYGVTPVTPSGTNFAAIATDVKSLFSTAISANLDISNFVWIMTPTTALALSLMQTSLGNPQFPTLNINGGTFMGLNVVVSNAANISGSPDYANMMVLVNPSEVFLADDGQVAISISNEASFEMLDNPTNASAGSSAATTMVSMFQTNSLAIKAVRFINWTKARSQACAFIRTAAYA